MIGQTTLIISGITLGIALLTLEKHNLTPSFVDKNTFLLDNSSNPPIGNTGAPGEGTCTGCHSGSTLPASGVVTFSFSGTNNLYVPGVTYDVSLETNTGTKNGFQMTALDGTNAAAGTFVAGTGSSIISANNKNYIRHATSSGISTWNFDWNAPSTSVGPITFYYTLNVTNANGNTGGDQIYVGNTVISEDISSGIFESNKLASQIEMKVQNRELNISYNISDASSIYFCSQDINGKQVDYHNFGKMTNGIHSHNILLDSKYSSGVYLFTVFVNNNPVTKKIYID